MEDVGRDSGVGIRRNGAAQATPETAREIERCLAEGLSTGQICARYGEVAGMYAKYRLDPLATLQTIGEEWGGVTRECVRQRFAAAGLPSRTPEQIASLRRQRRLADIREQCTAELRAAWVSGSPMDEIAKQFGLQPGELRTLVAEIVGQSERDERASARRRRRRDARAAHGAADNATQFRHYASCVRRAWDAQGRPKYFIGRQYATVARRDASLPSLSKLVVHFRWSELLAEAQIPSHPRTRRGNYSRISPAECWSALHLVAAELQAPETAPTRNEYIRRSTGRPELPCAATVERRLGGWEEIETAWPGPTDAAVVNDKELALAA